MSPTIAPTPVDPPSGSTSLVYAFKEKAPRIAMAYALGQAAWPWGKKLHTWVRNRQRYTITVHGGDDIYFDLHEWVLTLLPSKDRRSLYAMSVSEGHSNKSLDPSPDIEVGQRHSRVRKRIRLHFDGEREQIIQMDGHSVTVTVNEGESAFFAGQRYTMKEPTIAFTVHSEAARDAVHCKLESILQDHYRDDKRPTLRIGMSWGSWKSCEEIPMRTMESVVLSVEQEDRLVSDMAQFLDAEDEYAKRCIPWKRGYLFTGEAGTGKTSAAKALANHFGLDIWYLPLGDVTSGSNLIDLVSSVAPRSMLLIEDIDVFHVARQRDDEDQISLSDLLNALDGVTSPWGLITVLTTNHPEVLDDALTRPGRVDVREHFGLAANEQIEGLLRWFYPEWLGDISGPTSGGTLLAPAEVVGVMHRNLYDPEAAIKELTILRRAKALRPL